AAGRCGGAREHRIERAGAAGGSAEADAADVAGGQAAAEPGPRLAPVARAVDAVGGVAEDAPDGGVDGVGVAAVECEIGRLNGGEAAPLEMAPRATGIFGFEHAHGAFGLRVILRRGKL